MITTLEELKEFLDITAGAEDTKLLRVLQSAEKFMEDRTKRTFSTSTRTQKIDGNGKETIWLRDLPITSITSVTIDDVAMTVGDYEYDDETGEFWNSGLANFTPGRKNITVVYVAGWTKANAPHDLKQAIYSVAASLWRKRGSEGVQSESTGDHSVTYESGKVGLPNEIKEIIELYTTPHV